MSSAGDFLAQYAPLLRQGLRPRDPEVAAAFDEARERLQPPRPVSERQQLSLDEALAVRDRAHASEDDRA